MRGRCWFLRLLRCLLGHFNKHRLPWNFSFGVKRQLLCKSDTLSRCKWSFSDNNDTFNIHSRLIPWDLLSVPALSCFISTCTETRMTKENRSTINHTLLPFCSSFLLFIHALFFFLPSIHIHALFYFFHADFFPKRNHQSTSKIGHFGFGWW